MEGEKKKVLYNMILEFKALRHKIPIISKVTYDNLRIEGEREKERKEN